MRLFSVNRRWYQLIVEADSSAVQGEQANRFIKSFKITD
jgi:hypothetical protein